MDGGTGGGETINGNLGNRSRTCGPSGLYSQIYFQPRSQSYWTAVFLPGAYGSVCGDVPVAADAHSPGLAAGEFANRGRNQAGAVSGTAHHARHHHGVLRADHCATGGIRKLLFADSDWRAGYGVPGPEHAFVLDDVCGVRGDPCGVLRLGRRTAARVDGISAAECGAAGWSGGGTRG